MIFLIIFLAGALAAFFVPVWWTIVPIAFLTAYVLARRGRGAFWMGFAANAIIWLALSFMKSAPNGHLLAGRMAGLFHLNNLALLFIFTALIAGLLGGLSAAAGRITRLAILEKKVI